MNAPRRDFAAELAAARARGDWDAHAAIWEARRSADVGADEQALPTEADYERARQAVASDPRNANFPEWCASVLAGDHDDCGEIRAVLARGR